MKRRELLKHTLLAAGAGFTGMAPAMAQDNESQTRMVTGGGTGPSFTTSKCA